MVGKLVADKAREFHFLLSKTFVSPSLSAAGQPRLHPGLKRSPAMCQTKALADGGELVEERRSEVPLGFGGKLSFFFCLALTLEASVFEEPTAPNEMMIC